MARSFMVIGATRPSFTRGISARSASSDATSGQAIDGSGRLRATLLCVFFSVVVMGSGLRCAAPE